jgi:hypothetical protein
LDFFNTSCPKGEGVDHLFLSVTKLLQGRNDAK